MSFKLVLRSAAKFRIGLIALATLTFAGCFGGGNGGSSTASPQASSVPTTAVGNFLADQISGATYLPATGLTIRTLISNGGGNYSFTYRDMILTGSVWGSANSTLTPQYYLSPTGWALQTNTGSIQDNGNGSTITYTQTGELPMQASISRTELVNTSIACRNSSGLTVPCIAPANYPAGAASYQLIMTSPNTTQYYLQTGAGYEVTDTLGTPMTVQPTVGTTFCDPQFHILYVPIVPTPASGQDNYFFSGVVGCNAIDITRAIQAIAAVAPSTVLITNQATGNTTVPNVLHIKATSSGGASGAVVLSYTNFIYGQTAGNVWMGMSVPANSVTNYWENNKIAINAELVASGLPPLP